ncbi:hypothetical protein ONZ45_g1095 [Pleurotus djamor]|nr:hypothetical protein ONZ45_g1095 [Pleurotus djamor]
MVNSNLTLPSKVPTSATPFLSLLRIPQPYKTVWEADSVDEFKHAFIDLFKRHYYAYRLGILRYQPLDAISPSASSAVTEVVKSLKFADLIQEGSEPLAILNDLDYGQHVGYLHDVDCAKDIPLYPAPNNAFGPPDLLIREEDVQSTEIELLQYRYRYDLEAFLYVLVWVASHYKPGLQRKMSTRYGLTSWESWYRIDRHEESKNNVRQNFDEYNCTDSFIPLVRAWIEPMFDLQHRQPL